MERGSGHRLGLVRRIGVLDKLQRACDDIVGDGIEGGPRILSCEHSRNRSGWATDTSAWRT